MKVTVQIKVAFIASLFVLNVFTVFAYPTVVGSWADRIVEKIDVDYARSIVEHLVSIGSYTTPDFLGFRVTGTSEDYETAMFLADQMKSIGLVDVALEGVPVDAWRIKGAWLTIENGETYSAASMGGIPGTDEDGIKAEIVYVGKGLRPDYEKLEADGIDVKGKLVLAYWSPEDVWVDMIAHEATLHGALGVILFNPPGGTYGQGPYALQSFDATYRSGLIPLITISKEAAAEILELMKKGPVKATMVSLIEMGPGTGWNTVGYIRGKMHPEEYLIFAAHHDAWFFGAVDDSSAVAAIMTIAKAIIDSGYEPDRTLVFTTHTAEEYGYTDAYYDWCIGAWWQITNEHPEWQESAIAYLNFEGMGFPGPLELNVAQELKGFLMKELGRNEKLRPYGWNIYEAYSWNELWTFVAAGVPGITFSSGYSWWTNYYYHTQLDAIDTIDWGYLANIMVFCTKVAVDLDQSTIQPYNFETRAKHLLDHLDPRLMRDANIDPTAILTEAKRFLEVAQDFEKSNKRGVSPDVACMVQKTIREAVRILESNFTALSVWDDTIYPHEQVELDATHLRKAIKALEKGDPSTAMRELEWWISLNWYAPRVSYEVFARELTRHASDYYKLTWGAQGHLVPYLDLWHEYNSLAYKKATGITDFSDEIASFKIHYTAAVKLYQERIDDITDTLKVVVSLLESAIGLLQ